MGSYFASNISHPESDRFLQKFIIDSIGDKTFRHQLMELKQSYSNLEMNQGLVLGNILYLTEHPIE